MSELFEKICSAASEGQWSLFGFTMISDKYGVESAKFVPNNRCQDIYSVAKAFTVTAVGLAYDRGLIKVTDKFTDILADKVPEGIDERWRNITIHDAMKHKMGLPGGYLDIDVCEPGHYGTDYLDVLFKTPFVSEPCVDYKYTDAAFYIVARAVEQVMGEPIDNLLWRELFAPMKYAEAAWSHCPQGHPMGATGLYIRCVDMVKLGELYRKGGVWEGQRLISEEWVNLVLTKGYELNKRDYPGSYGKGGMNGQDLVVYPSMGLSVGWQGYKHGHGSDITKMIVEAAESGQW